MLINPIRTPQGDLVKCIHQRGNTYHTTLFLAGTAFNKEVALVSPLPMHQALSILLSSPPRAELHYDRTSGNLVILPKGGLAGGKNIEDLIRKLELLLKSADYGEKLADALIANNLDPNNIPKNHAKRFLEIAVNVLNPDPLGEFGNFRDELAKLAENRIEQFAKRLADAQASNEAWLKKHQLVQEKQRLTSFISRTENEIQEKESLIEIKKSRIEGLEKMIAAGKAAITEAESALNRIVQGRNAWQNRASLESEKTNIEQDIENRENFKEQHPSLAHTLNVQIAKLKKN